jgi:flagellar basal-body rod modification protein FlgD
MINAVSTSASNSSGASAMKQSTGLDKNDFLQMLVAQLKNQDPLSPQDSSAFVAQLAQITQVEQTYNVNANLESLMAAQNSANSLSAVSLIGKVVSAQGSQVALTSGTPSTLNFTLPSAATQVKVEIRDANGNIVRTLTQGATETGAGSIAWDGKDDNNNTLVSGKYSFSVSGTDASGQAIQGTSMIQGQVSGVRLAGSTLVLTVNGLDVPLSSVLEVKGGSV